MFFSGGPNVIRIVPTFYVHEVCVNVNFLSFSHNLKRIPRNLKLM